MLVRRAGKGDAAGLAHRAARPIAAGDPAGADRPAAAVGLLERGGDVIVALLETGKLGVPLHRHPELAQSLAHDELVVVLAEHEDVRIRRHAVARIAQPHVRQPAALRPDVAADARLAELERATDDTEMSVDFERAGLHAERPRFARRAGVPVDDPHPHAAPSISPVGPAPTIRTSVSMRASPGAGIYFTYGPAAARSVRTARPEARRRPGSIARQSPSAVSRRLPRR